MQGLTPPPSAWADDHVGLGPLPAPGAGESPIQDARDVALVSSAWKHLKSVAGRDETRHADLYDLLASSLREVQYTFAPLEWPQQLRPVGSAMSEMPEVVLKRYAACQTVAFCGVFPELRRAWASVDSSLFLWRYDRWQDVPLEYSGEEQSIVSVGLAPARPGVFVAAIRQLLVVCTTTEVMLLGVCRAEGVDGDTADELTLAPLPLYAAPTDGVTMTSVAATRAGRVFLGGADGQLYELQYRAAEQGSVLGVVAGRWRGGRRSTLVCHTAGVRRFLPSVLPAFVLPQPSPLLELAVDDDRGALYARAADSALLVFDLGPDGAAGPHRVAECRDVLAEASRALGGREALNRGLDAGGAGRAAPPPLAIAALLPVPRSESARLALVTVTAEGQRIYWSVHPPTGGVQATGGGPAAPPRPDRLRAEFVRAAPLVRVPAAAPAPGGPAASPFFDRQGRGGDVVGAAAAADGALVLAESGAGEGERATARLLSIARDPTQPPLRPAVGASLSGAGSLWFREAVAELPQRVPGQVCALRPVSGGAGAAVAPAPPGSAAASASLRPRPRFVLSTSAGVLEFERLRPVDTLALLLEAGDARQISALLRALGPVECAALLALLAGLGSPREGAAVPASPAAISRARAALADPRLVARPLVADGAVGPAAAGRLEALNAPPPTTANGLPAWADVTPGAASALAPQTPAAPAQAFDMGAPVPVAEQEWTATHRGLCLLVSRVLAPALWDEPVFVVEGPDALLRPALDEAALARLEGQLERLAALAASLHGDAAERERHGGGDVDGGADAGAATGEQRWRASAAAGDAGLALTTPAHQATSAAASTAAARREESRRARAIAALLSRAAQACFLLRTLRENNVGRLIARAGPELRRQALALRLHDWSVGADGEAAIAAIVAALLGERIGAAADGAAAGLAAELRAGCPALFGEDDRVYYRALAALARAERAETAQDREEAVAEATRLLVAVPLAVDLSALGPRLARLGAWAALVATALRRAVAGAGAADAVEVPVVNALRALLPPTSEPLPPGWEPLRAEWAAQRSAGELAAMRRDLLRAATGEGPGSGVALASRSERDDAAAGAAARALALPGAPDAPPHGLLAAAATALREGLYGCLLDAGALPDLLGAPEGPLPGCEAFFIRAGGLAGAAQASQVPPLQPRQVAALVALARLYTGRESYLQAAQAYEVLADVPSALLPGGEPALGLAQRAEFLEAAVLQARSAADSALLEQLDSKTRILAVQRRIVEALLALADERPLNEDLLLVLKSSVRPLAELYNDVAVPKQLWSCCLEMVCISAYGDAAYVMHLWDLCLKAAWEGGWAAAAPDSEMDDPHQSAIEALESMAEEVENLALRSPSVDENSFPLAHILLRLEQAAAGLWPLATDLCLDTQRPGVAATAAAGGSAERVLHAYELLLSGSGAVAALAGDEEVSTGRADFRARLLAGAAHLLGSAAAALRQGAAVAGSQREAASLLSGCDLLASHARRLGAQGAEAALRLDQIADELRAGARTQWGAAGGGAAYSHFANGL